MNQEFKPLKLLHTSDWHLGRTLYGKKRYEEFKAYLCWLSETILKNKIDVLLVAGDIFDTSAPSNRAQELYYRFLCRIADSPCRHVVIIAGNHDSPTFLNAPKELLKILNVHVVGCAAEVLDDEILTLHNKQGIPELIVCAVPYLRDRDIRLAEAGESVEDKEKKMIEGIRHHYSAAADLAKKKQVEAGFDVPIIAMGHLFTAGGITIDGDGVRELYVGSLAHVSTGVFPDCFSYIALGHLHVPQKVNDLESIRYSGSPLPMGFGEAKQQKSICQVEFNGTSASIQLINVPVFQKLERIKGDWEGILSRIIELAAANFEGWLEIVYEGSEVIGDLRERLEDAISDTQIEILRIKNTRIIESVLGQTYAEETLDDLNVNDVFEQCLAVHAVPEEQRPGLLRTYQEAVLSLQEDDVQAE